MGIQDTIFNAGKSIMKSWDTVSSVGSFVDESFEFILVSDTPFGIKPITSIVNGFEWYSNMFDNQVCYGYLSVSDTQNNLNEYTEGTASYLVIRINGIDSVHKVLKCRKMASNVPNSYDNVYIFEFMSLIGYQFLRQRSIPQINTSEFPTIGRMLEHALCSDSNLVESITMSSQAQQYLKSFKPFNGPYEDCVYVPDTIGVATLKQPRFNSRAEQIDFLCQYAIPTGYQDITNTINDFWVWQPNPNIILCESITALFKQTPKAKMTYGGLPHDEIFSTEIHCETFELKRMPNSESEKVNVKITIDPTSRSTSVYKNSVGKIKDKNNLSLNKSTPKTSLNKYEENVSYSIGSNSDVNRNIDYMNKNGENINDFGFDSKRIEMRDDFFTGLMSFYATISINRNMWNVTVGSIIELSIYKKPTDNYSSEELDKGLSGRWLVIEKASHMRSNGKIGHVYGIVKDSVNG